MKNSICMAFIALVSFGNVYSVHAQPDYQRSITRRIVSNTSSLPGMESSYIREGSISNTATGGQSTNRIVPLPQTIHGPAVGMPGDGISRGLRSGALAQGRPSGNLANGLPQCRSSPYIDGYGDHIRSDMGRRIDGTVRLARGSSKGTKARAPATGQPIIFKYGNSQ
jgi:hypothetical protein